MNKVIAVLNYKGGTGKTTTVVNLAAGLAMRGARVLCIDLDAQGSLGTYLGVKHHYSLTHLLFNKAKLTECIVPARENLDIIVSDESLMHVERMLWQVNTTETPNYVLSAKMNGVTNYDYILLDHSPSRGLLSDNGLFYAQLIIVPVAMNYLALIGTRQVLKKIKTITEKSKHQIQLAMLVPTFYYAKLRKDREIMQILEKHFTGKISEPIRASVMLSEAPGHQKSIYEYAPRSTGAIDYAQLVERVAEYG